jgi:hypothetical protein
MIIDLSPVRKLYDKVIHVEEYYHDLFKWKCQLPGGVDVRDPDLYYKNSIEEVVQMCINAGAVKIQFKCMHEGKYGYPDYKISELTHE